VALKELWRRMKTKAKVVARNKKVDLETTGGGEALIAEIGEEILALLNIIAGDLRQIHNAVDDDAPPIPAAPTSLENG
jgi:hypothetical protein